LIGNYVLDDRYALGAAPGTWDRIRGWFGSGPTPVVGDQSQGTPDDYAAGGGAHTTWGGGGFTDAIRKALSAGFTGRTQADAAAPRAPASAAAVVPSANAGMHVDVGLVVAAGVGLIALAGAIYFLKSRKGRRRR